MEPPIRLEKGTIDTRWAFIKEVPYMAIVAHESGGDEEPAILRSWGALQGGIAMNAKFISALSAVAIPLGLCVLPALPALAGPITLTYKYVYFGSSGSHQRQPRTINATGGFTLLKTQSTPNALSPGDVLQIQQPVTPWPSQPTLNLAFVTVNGGSLVNNGLPATVTWTDFANPATPIHVLDAPISILVVYVPAGGGCGAPPCPPASDWGATIDSYDETKESLFDDNFVKVTPDDRDGSLTTSGNVDGYVDTTKSAETITAVSPTTQFDNIPPDRGDKFSRWLLLGPSTTTSSAPALTVGKQVSLTALAIYDSPVLVNLGCQAVPSDVQNQLFVTNTTSQPIPAGSEISYTYTENTNPSGSPPNFVTTKGPPFTLTSQLQPNKSVPVPNPPRGTGGTCEASLSSIQ